MTTCRTEPRRRADPDPLDDPGHAASGRQSDPTRATIQTIPRQPTRHDTPSRPRPILARDHPWRPVFMTDPAPPPLRLRPFRLYRGDDTKEMADAGFTVPPPPSPSWRGWSSPMAAWPCAGSWSRSARPRCMTTSPPSSWPSSAPTSPSCAGTRTAARATPSCSAPSPPRIRTSAACSVSCGHLRNLIGVQGLSMARRQELLDELEGWMQSEREPLERALRP